MHLDVGGGKRKEKIRKKRDIVGKGTGRDGDFYNDLEEIILAHLKNL